MNLEAIRFEDECPSIRYSLQLETSGENRFRHTLIISFTGEVGSGSGGNSDARYMLGVMHTAHNIWRTKAVIIDLSGLVYEWGDEMGVVISPINKFTPTSIVIGPGCRRALSTLELGEATNRDITELDNVFDNLKEAWDYLQRLE